MPGFKYEKDDQGIVVLTMDMGGTVNKMDAEYRAAMAEAVNRLEAEQDLTGVVITSGKNSFFAGGDLDEMLAVTPGQEAELMARIEKIKADLRRLEFLPVPVVAAINGAALGGGFEICLACQHRIAYRDKRVMLGLPEVTLGLLPAGGGVVRMVKLLGLERALPFLIEGTQLPPERALEAGIIHDTVDDIEDLVPSAKRWLLEHKGDEKSAQALWDRSDYRTPGGNIRDPKVMQLIATEPAALIKKTRGLLPAPERVLDCAVDALRLDIDAALRVETRHQLYLLYTPQARNLMTHFLQMKKVNSGASRPQEHNPPPITRVGVLGAGMMGQGIAYVTAMAGIPVVLKDISQESADKGKNYSRKLLDKRVARGKMTEDERNRVLDLIIPTADDTELQGCNLIVEAVFEDLSLKKKITGATEPNLAEGGVWASNTSSLPITQLAEASANPANVIGLHFFSPVDKMPLVEIICGQQTSDATLARAYDFIVKIRKTPIVVNDSLGFFTSRTFGTCLDEGVRMLYEGVHPVQIDRLGSAIGMPVGPLTLSDEVGQVLNKKVQDTWREMGVLDSFGEQRVWREVLSVMVDQYGRGGRHHGGGFYEYSEDGTKTIWPTLYDLYYKPEYQLPETDISDRLLFRPVIESLKCLEEGVLHSVADGNVGSLLGIGAPSWTGGYIQFINSYGPRRFVSRCRELASAYGERFDPPKIALEKVETGELFV